MHTVLCAQGHEDLLTHLPRVTGAPWHNPAPNHVPMSCLSPTKNIEHAEWTRVVLLQPRVNTLPMELMGARDDPQLLERSGEEEDEQGEPCSKTWMMEVSLEGWTDV